MSREEIEAALAASFDREHLAVYGDYLMSIGDPRGELIAIDLAGRSDERAARKRELVEEWLGDEIAALVFVVGGVDTGFLRVHATSVYTEAAQRVLASPAGDYVRSIAITADEITELERAFATIDARPRPWLVELDISACEGIWAVHAALHSVTSVRALRRLRVPSIRDETQLHHLELALGAMRDDAEIVVARVYVGFDPMWPLSPRIRIGPRWPWPPPDTFGHDVLRVFVDYYQLDEDVSVAQLMRAVERAMRHFDELDKVRWSALFARVAATPGRIASSARELKRGLAPLDLADDDALAALRDAVGRSQTDNVAFVRIRG